MSGPGKVTRYSYHEWFGSPEPCPALYIDVSAPTEQEPFVKDQIAALDTGAALTALPVKYKSTIRLHPHRRIRILWPGCLEDTVPAYLVRVTAGRHAPRLVEMIYDPNHEDYALIGRNLMKHWRATLKGPEQILEISE